MPTSLFFWFYGLLERHIRESLQDTIELESHRTAPCGEVGPHFLTGRPQSRGRRFHGPSSHQGLPFYFHVYLVKHFFWHVHALEQCHVFSNTVTSLSTLG